MSSKSVSQIFKILFQIRDINIFDLRGFFLSRYKKKLAVKLETHFSREAIEN